jgi:hypothetical protein
MFVHNNDKTPTNQDPDPDLADKPPPRSNPTPQVIATGVVVVVVLNAPPREAMK